MRRLIVSSVIAVFAAFPMVAQAQAPALGAPDGPHRALTLQAGGFTYDQADGQRAPMLGLRMNWALSPIVVSELGATFARVNTADVPAGQPLPAPGAERRNLGTLTVGVQAQAPLPYVQPYVGVATGLVRQLDRPGGDAVVRPTTAFPLGLRVPLSEHVGVRGELRYRFDDFGAENGANTEATVGVSVKF